MSEQCQIAKRKRYREKAGEQTYRGGQPQSAGLPGERHLLELSHLVSERCRLFEFEIFGVLGTHTAFFAFNGSSLVTEGAATEI